MRDDDPGRRGMEGRAGRRRGKKVIWRSVRLCIPGCVCVPAALCNLATPRPLGLTSDLRFDQSGGYLRRDEPRPTGPLTCPALTP